MINGGTFSAASIISSNLKGSKRATFVGEETGGAYNGTVAGIMPLIKLPNSEINIKMGLLVVAPFYKATLEGHGVYPDKEIVPTIADYVNGKDPELNWIFQDIKKNSTILEENQKAAVTAISYQVRQSSADIQTFAQATIKELLKREGPSELLVEADFSEENLIQAAVLILNQAKIFAMPVVQRWLCICRNYKNNCEENKC